MATHEKNFVKYQLNRNPSAMQKEFNEYLKTFDPPLIRTYEENGVMVKVFGAGGAV